MSLILAPADVPQANSQPRRGGPQAAEGKEQSRRNALKRGLRSKIVFPDDMAAIIDKRAQAFAEEFAPRTPYEEMLVRDMAISSARIERCASLSIADLIRVADRAAECWEPDRRMSVENFAAKLSKDPARVACGLRRSCQGVDWLLDRWEGLGEVVKASGRWDDDQRRLAFDMLGIPHELRSLTTEVPGNDDTEALIALVETQLTMLRNDQVTVLEALSEAEQAMTVAGMPLEEDGATARLRKDESRARSDFSKALKELLRYRAEPTAPDKPRPQTTSDRPPISGPASDNMVQRSKLAVPLNRPVAEGTVRPVSDISAPPAAPVIRNGRHEPSRC